VCSSDLLARRALAALALIAVSFVGASMPRSAELDEPSGWRASQDVREALLPLELVPDRKTLGAALIPLTELERLGRKIYW
jgi:hypothetical protein